MTGQDLSVSISTTDANGPPEASPSLNRLSPASTPQTALAATACRLIEELFGPEPPVAFELWDGSRIGPSPAPATIRLDSPRALARVVHSPGQLGLARAYVTGELSVEGDIFAALALPEMVGPVTPRLSQLVRLAWVCRRRALRRLPVPPEEAKLRGIRHRRHRDQRAVSHHYDVSNDFYRLILGPTMTYSCAVWSSPGDGLEAAQVNKLDLVCCKLDLKPTERLLDVGCGWGSLAQHASQRYGASVLGITLSEQQHRWASEQAGLNTTLSTSDETPDAPNVEFRVMDYRDLDRGDFDAVSSVGMSEHVGRSRLPEYFQQLYRHLRPGGRVLNHAISAVPPTVAGSAARWPSLLRLPGRTSHATRSSFIDRYVFPDGELVEVGTVISAMQRAGFEVRHVESLREHYGLTLRAWVTNLEENWDQAVSLVGVRRTLIWHLYMAAAARSFETGHIAIHQVLAVKADHGCSGFALRPRFDQPLMVRRMPRHLNPAPPAWMR